ncbi:MAG: beta-aspartyl-peptidase [Planctomycetota bacterium]
MPSRSLPFELLIDADLYAPEALGRRSLLICGGKVLWIGEGRPELPAEFDCLVRDLEGRRTIPGLIDGHAHITGGGGECGYETRVPSVPLSQFTRAGITSVIGLLGTDDVTRDTRTLVATARGLCAEGIDAWCFTGGYHLPPMTLTGSVRGDIVHIDRIIGAGEIAISDHRSSQPTLDEILRIASEVHVAGIMTAKAGVLHLHLGDGERGLGLVREALAGAEIPARVYHPTHCNRRRELFEEACELTRSGCAIDMTAFPESHIGEDEYSAAEAWQRYRAAGLPAELITISSDGGGCMPSFDAKGLPVGMTVGDPGELAATLSSLIGDGCALEEVLPAFTSNVAELMRLPGKGRLQVGQDADLVVLDEVGKPSDVMARGRWHVVDHAPVVLGTFEER